ncbi:MAG: ABC transporter permease [Gemmatimonadota bacterium]
MWYRRLLNVFRRDHLSADVARELDFHIAERADELVAHGMSPEAAAREARRRFGHTGSIREATQDADLFTWLDAAWRDTRYAARSLAASRGFTIVAITSLALGIGANTAIFSLIDAVMLRDLPVRAPQELVVIDEVGGQDGAGDYTNPIWEQVRDGEHPFAGVLAYGDLSVNLADAGEVRPANGLWVSGGFFEMLGVRAERGRLLSPADDARGCPATAVLSYAFWQSTLGADPGVIGRTIAFSGHPVEVIGIADPRFQGLEAGRAPAFYVPLCAQPVVEPSSGFLDKRSYWFLRILGRLPAQLSLASANAELQAKSATWFRNTLPADWGAENQTEYLTRRLEAQQSLGALSGARQSYSGALMILMSIVALVLLVACANVANLMLVRAEGRQRELAVRVALGAGRMRVARQLLTEGLLLALVGAAIGIGLAYQGSHALLHFLSSAREPVSLDLSIDLRVLLFTAATAVLTALLFGMAPAWRAFRVDPHDALTAHGRGAGHGRSRFGFGKILVSAQVALSLVLVTGAALLLGSFRAVADVDKGFDDRNVLVAETNFRWDDATPEARHEIEREALARLRAIPGVSAAAASFRTPLERKGWNGFAKVPGVTLPRGDDALSWINLVGDGYFATMGMRLVAGRDYSAADRLGGPDVVIINEVAAARFFASRNPVGATIQMEDGPQTTRSYEVVGVVSNASYRSLRENPLAQLFLPLAQQPDYAGTVSFELKASGSAAALRPIVTRALAEISPRATIQFRELEQQVAETLRTDRLLATLSVFFGALALLLAMIGLYGTMAYSIARRRAEIGIRLALGAAPERVSREVLREVAVMLGLGLLFGLAGVLATTRLVEGFLFGVTPREPSLLIGSAIVLGVATLAAGYLPARRAAAMDPMEALRQD